MNMRMKKKKCQLNTKYEYNYKFNIYNRFPTWYQVYASMYNIIFTHFYHSFAETNNQAPLQRYIQQGRYIPINTSHFLLVRMIIVKSSIISSKQVILPSAYT